MALLELENVRAGYGGREILHGLSYSFTEGHNYCMVGPNGCGKTTLLRTMAALLPHSGRILLDGREVTEYPRRELAARLALLGQFSGSYFPAQVQDTVMLGRYRMQSLWSSDAGRKSDREAVEAALRAVGMWDERGRLLNELSGGQRQRVFLAQVLAQEPRLILLDEPTNHLDLRCQLELIDYLRQWSADGQHSVIGVFHDLNLARRLSSELLFMADGRLYDGAAADAVGRREFLRDLFGVDVAGYYAESLSFWQDM